MRKISLLDCTLRDGGCVNDFNFGTDYMNQIFRGVQDSKVEIIECGYIDETKGSPEGRTQFISDKAIRETLLKDKNKNAKYVAMIDYGKFDVRNLEERTSGSIDGIRLAFHKKNCKDMIEWGKIILSKGYELYIQPMLVMRYSDKELIEFIEIVNRELSEASAFYMVDSFGEMRAVDVNRVANIIDHNLTDGMPIGFHSHNNLQMSYSNAVNLIDFPTSRNLIFDVSILGMGKGAGNLNAEIFAEHLNIYHEKHYNISAMLEVIDKVLNQIRQDYTWGYSVEYYLSSINHCTPSYAGYFYKKHTLSIDEMATLLSMISEEKKISFDKEYASELYYGFMGRKIDDAKAINQLKGIFDGKEVLLFAPGKSIRTIVRKIEAKKENPNILVVAVNHIMGNLADYVFVTKRNIYEISKKTNTPMIVTSNIKTDGEDILINYDRYNELDGGKVDISIVLLLNLLTELNVKKIYMAGFDGFKSDMDDNYYDDKLRRPVTKADAMERNAIIKKAIKQNAKYYDIEFMTESLYQ
jgi:4-hydroxy 2-oxovalerate aldolase